MEIPITVKTLSSTAVVICCDLSKPHNVLNSVLRSISSTKEVVQRRAAELQASNVNELNAIRESIAQSVKGHPDAARLRYLDVPIVLVATKFDVFKSLPIADRRAVVNVLRFVAHYFGGTLMTMSGQDAAQRDNYRTLISAFGFGLPAKVASELNIEKHVYITRGQDSFHSILLGSPISSKGPEMDAAVASSKVRAQSLSNYPCMQPSFEFIITRRLFSSFAITAGCCSLWKNGIISSEAEMDKYLTHKGVTRDCWGR